MTSSADSAIRSNDGSATMQRLVLAQLREEAAAAARAGRFAAAERCYQRALGIDGDNADLWALLGTVVPGRPARAACARRALALVPDHHLALALLSGEVPLPGSEGPAGPAAGPPRALLIPAGPGPLPPAPAAAGESPHPSSGASGVVPAAPAARLPTPRLRPAAPRARRPFGEAFPWPSLDFGALGRSLSGRPRPRAVPTAAAAPTRRPIVLTLPRPQPRPPLQLTRPIRIRLAFAAALLLVVIVNLALAAWYERKYTGRIVPGVRIAGVDVGGLAPAEAERALEPQVTTTLNRVVRLEYADQSWTLTAAEIGLRYLTAQAVGEAAGLGHRASAGESWRERVRAGLRGMEVPLQVEAQGARLYALLDRVAAEVDRPAIPPAVSWQAGNWSISAGQDGRHVVRAEAQERLLTALTTLVHGDAPSGNAPLVVALPVMTDSAALSAVDFDRLRTELDLAAQPLTVRCADHTWNLTTADISAWLRVGLAPPAIAVDALALGAFLSDVEPLVAVPVQRPRMEVVDGRVSVFQVGSDGQALDIEPSLAQLRSALERRLRGELVEAVDLPIQVLPAVQDELMAEMGVLELIGEGHSSFRDSSWARVTNIVVGGRELNGRLVAPGEVFSLNDTLDPVTWEKGYVVSEIIVGGGVGYGMGGGLCQVATTLYRAVLRTGLEVVERHPHAWRLDWYEQDSPPGFDATIMIGEVDLRFRNNTDHYILIQTETSAEGAWQVVRIYGTLPGWQVSISEPARDGSGLYFRRTVTRDGQVLIDETVYSHY